MRTRHFQAIKRTKQNQIISLENLASKQRIFQIVKEQHGFMLTVRSKDCSHRPCGFSEQSQHRTRVRVPEGIGGGKSWWSQPGSNRRPPACKAGVLPAELWPQHWLVGLGGVAPPTSPLSGVRSN
jgi:hypothetical protein